MKRPLCFVFSILGSQWPGMGIYLIFYNLFIRGFK